MFAAFKGKCDRCGREDPMDTMIDPATPPPQVEPLHMATPEEPRYYHTVAAGYEWADVFMDGDTEKPAQIDFILKAMNYYADHSAALQALREERDEAWAIIATKVKECDQARAEAGRMAVELRLIAAFDTPCSPCRHLTLMAQQALAGGGGGTAP